MSRVMSGGLNDDRGRRYHGNRIEFRTAEDANWRFGTVFKQPKAPTVVKLHDQNFTVLGWQITEFVIRKDLPKLF